MNTDLHESLKNIQSWIVSQQTAIQDEIIELCNINSGSDNLTGLLRCADHLESLMSDLEQPCQRIDLLPRTHINDKGEEIQTATGPILRWNFRKNQSPPAKHSKHPTATLLAIHYDTVYGPNHAFQKCQWLQPDSSTTDISGQQELEDGKAKNQRLRGPGVIDAKGGIIVLRWCLKAAKHFGLLDKIDCSVVLNPDEEVGSPSTWPYWQEIAPEFGQALLFEPSLPNGNWVSQRRGIGNFVFIVRGKSAHAGRHFEAGRNAVVRAAEIAIAASGLNAENDGVTVNVGRLNGGQALNVVPNLAILRINVRVENNTQLAWLEDRLQTLAMQFDEPDNGFRVEMHGNISSQPKMIDKPTRQLMKKIESVASEIDAPIHWQPTGGASDGNKIASLGIAAIDTFGPEGDELHSPREWLQPNSIPKKSTITLGTLLRLSEEPNSGNK